MEKEKFRMEDVEILSDDATTAKAQLSVATKKLFATEDLSKGGRAFVNMLTDEVIRLMEENSIKTELIESFNDYFTSRKMGDKKFMSDRQSEDKPKRVIGKDLIDSLTDPDDNIVNIDASFDTLRCENCHEVYPVKEGREFRDHMKLCEKTRTFKCDNCGKKYIASEIEAHKDLCMSLL